jgi:hypothetical protein
MSLVYSSIHVFPETIIDAALQRNTYVCILVIMTLTENNKYRIGGCTSLLR